MCVCVATVVAASAVITVVADAIINFAAVANAVGVVFVTRVFNVVVVVLMCVVVAIVLVLLVTIVIVVVVVVVVVVVAVIV